MSLYEYGAELGRKRNEKVLELIYERMGWKPMSDVMESEPLYRITGNGTLFGTTVEHVSSGAKLEVCEINIKQCGGEVPQVWMRVPGIVEIDITAKGVSEYIGDSDK